MAAKPGNASDAGARAIDNSISMFFMSALDSNGTERRVILWEDESGGVVMIDEAFSDGAPAPP